MMDRKNLLNLVKDLSETKIKSIAFTGGGEPTMNPALKEALIYLKKNPDIQMVMYSNGSMMERFDLFETITESLEWIRVSIDSGSKKSHDDLRVTNASNGFDTVISNIKKLVETKKRKNEKTFRDRSSGLGFNRGLFSFFYGNFIAVRSVIRI